MLLVYSGWRVGGCVYDGMMVWWYGGMVYDVVCCMVVYSVVYGVGVVQWSACRRLCALSSDDWFYVVQSLASHVDLQQVQHHHCFLLPRDAL